MLKFFKVSLAAIALLVAACSDSSKTPSGAVDINTILADIQTACSYQPTATQVMAIAEEVAAALGNPALIAGTTIGTVVATAVIQTVCAQKEAAVKANASLKSLVKGAKESLTITINQVTIDGKTIDIKPVTVSGTVTG
jgi:hypothetical protein